MLNVLQVRKMMFCGCFVMYGVFVLGMNLIGQDVCVLGVNELLVNLIWYVLGLSVVFFISELK